ncbi:hypothetical protein SEA_WEASELS2_135 [Rhodococcus phage Weasels2]|uniref:Uncharacterized protein n=1 Tax=Rhodococcus phage Weasels2 TaxID=1897437 RepID=A0A1I9SAB4_9CAUD|nr:hypothetical protein FDH04_gp274 [Rhodococcus phage Weasels2]AOZ63720.1 hypothetical protein SEA_WEASELS2_135 [Rhodococcus phage Weasels2]
MKQIQLSKDDIDDLEGWFEDEAFNDPRLGKLLSNRKVRSEYDD